MEKKYLWFASIFLVRSMKLKFGIYIIGHHWTNTTDINECSFYLFYKKTKITPKRYDLLKESNYFKHTQNLVSVLCVTIPHIASILGQFRMSSFFARVQKIFYTLRL